MAYSRIRFEIQNSATMTLVQCCLMEIEQTLLECKKQKPFLMFAQSHAGTANAGIFLDSKLTLRVFGQYPPKL